MATKNKTIYTEASVTDFLNTVDNEQKRKDSFRLVELMQQWSGFAAKMWGPSIVGFGSYHYQYASGHEGDAPLIGFSPRKAALTLYVTGPGTDNDNLLAALGKYKKSKACIYVKKLDDLDLKVLEKISKASLKYISEKHECPCRE